MKTYRLFAGLNLSTIVP